MLSISCISRNAGKNCQRMIYPAYWLTYTIATPIAFLITTLFWCAVYTPRESPFDANTYFVHINNSCVMFIDIILVAHPTNLAHVIYPVLFGIIYMLFSFLYYLAGGLTREGEPYIYAILDWRKPFTALLICVGAFAYLVAMFVMVYLLSKSRKKLHDAYFMQNQGVQ
nr:unnamed protein product [Callosobruchus analis]